ncbi:shikimate dehydrogenase [Shimia abyssi]|uniref:Shikimate dehydrogenase n=1 Tax=Shimia abyssi TaxID=1662395 RepID=A0A2P8FI22_9RHOB|nr:shikimate dehydrogenase [Shimia abyssi]PSL21368.1 shikimate dehydrogenase [Shimia abyssi]
MKAALIGDHIGPSLTPALHEAEGAALGLGYHYERIDTGGTQLDGPALRALLTEAQANKYCGLNITHPYKELAATLVDHLEGPARDLEVINTVLFRDGRWIGHNTDYCGFRGALLGGIGRVEGQNILLSGAGGAGRAVALALADCGAARVCIFDPKPGKAKEVTSRLSSLRPKTHWYASSILDAISMNTISGFVNCTPLGMASHPGMAIDPSLLPPDAWIADIVYFPPETTLLKTARRQGRPVMNGTAMALWQAVEAFALITGHAPNHDRMARHLNTLLETNLT